jgi:hypothetical protein
VGKDARRLFSGRNVFSNVVKIDGSWTFGLSVPPSIADGFSSAIEVGVVEGVSTSHPFCFCGCSPPDEGDDRCFLGGKGDEEEFDGVAERFSPWATALLSVSAEVAELDMRLEA